MTIKTTFSIDELSLKPPKIQKNLFHSKIVNSNNNKNYITIENIKLFKNPIVNNNMYTQFYTTTDFELKALILSLENKIKQLYNKYIDNNDNINYDSIIRYENMTLVSKFIVNNKLTLLENDIDLTKNYNINLELYSVVLNNDTIYLLWKLKSLQVESSSNYLLENELNYDRDHLQTQIIEEKDLIIKDLDNKLLKMKENYNRLENIYIKIIEEKNIENLNLLYEDFLVNY